MNFLTTYECPDSRITINGEYIFTVSVEVTFGVFGKELPGTLFDPPEYQEIYTEDIRLISVNENDNSFSEKALSFILRKIEGYWNCHFYETIEDACEIYLSKLSDDYFDPEEFKHED